MKSITLRAYNQFVKSLIEQGNYDEAIFHCNVILRSFPKCIETYQFLGKSLLSSKRFTETAEVYSKVLTVIPDDFDSQTALSAVAENDHNLDSAIAHMEQAFEIRPSNPQAQEELLRLVGQRDGNPPAKIRLTRGALIRMYAKGELYSQAITETQALCQTEPDREDLKLLLARMYYLSESPAEAMNICSEILDKLPFCYEANQIMLDLVPKSDEAEQPSIYQQRLSELDPYFAYVDKNIQVVADVPAEKIVLDQPDYSISESEPSKTIDWADQIGVAWPMSTETPIHGEDQINAEESIPTSADLSIDNSSSPALEDAQEVPPDVESISKPVQDNELPDWIAKAGWIRAPENENNQEIVPEPIIAHVEPVLDASQLASPANDLPEWLKPLNPNNVAAEDGISKKNEEAVDGMADSAENEISNLSADEIESLISAEDLSSLDFLKQPSIEESVESSVGSEVRPDTLETVPETAAEEIIPELPDWLKNYEMEEIDNSVFDTAVQDSALPSAFSAVDSDESPDFITDLVTSDLVGQEETSEISIPPQSLQPEEIIPTEGALKEIRLESELEPVQPEVIEKQIPAVPIESSIKMDQVPHAPALPSWVKQVLRDDISGTSVPPIIPPIVSQIGSSSTENKSTTPAEPIEELITDVEGLQSGEGAISEEVNADLMSWLKDINPEDEIDQDTSLPEPPVGVVEPEIGEISLEQLVEPASAGAEITSIPEELSEEAALASEPDTSSIEARLSDLMGSQVEPPPFPSEPLSEVSATVVEAEVSSSDGELLTELIHTGNYSELSRVISGKSLPADVTDQLLTDLKNETSSDNTTFEVWQIIGDLHLQKSNPTDALQAYREAEKLLFS